MTPILTCRRCQRRTRTPPHSTHAHTPRSLSSSSSRIIGIATSALVTILLLTLVQSSTSFQLQPLPPSSLSRRCHHRHSRIGKATGRLGTTSTGSRTTISTQLFAGQAPSPLPDTTDPFILLGLDPNNPTADKKEIKRAYKRQAMRYHPDVVVTTESSADERRRASEEFARINAAYEVLSGKGSGSGTTTAGGTSGGRKGGSSTGSGYQPPHRRSASYGSSGRSGSGGSSSSPYGSSGGPSTDWRDYMPNYDEEDSKYDAGDDSFSKIFSDLMTGVAAGAAGAAVGSGGAGGGGGGILKDLIEFLEGNVDGFASGSYEDDSTLSELLAFGSMEDVSNEMDDTQLLVTQLETKIDNMEKEVVMLKEEVRQSSLEYSRKYVERIELEEHLAEVEARKGVVGNYLKKARKRLVKLQGRYKELIVSGRGDRRAGSGGYNSEKSSRSYDYSSARTARGNTSSSNSSNAYGREANTSPGSSYSSARSSNQGASASASSPSPSPAKDGSESFSSTEGFGSFGRRGGRGTSRGRRRNTGSESQPAEPPSSSPPREQTNASARSSPSPPPASRPSTSSSSSPSAVTGRSITKKNEWTPPVPPHRRTGPDPRQVADDKKRLRDIKVDDEFDKLKRELGL